MWHPIDLLVDKLTPRNWRSLFRRANQLLHEGSYENAARTYDTVLEEAPGHPAALFGRAVARQALHLPYAALADFDSLLQLEPEHLSALVGRASIEMRFDHYPQALGYLDAALEIAPEHAAALAKRAITRLHLGFYAEAIVDCNEAILLHPQLDDTTPRPADPTAHISASICQAPLSELFFTRGSAFLALYRNDYAIADFTQAIGLNPNHEPSYRQRGFAYHFLGRHALGDQDHETACQLKAWSEAELNSD